MKVECVVLTDPRTNESIEKNSWLTVGKVYQVLSVFIVDGGSIEYRLMADDGETPGMYKADQFKVVSDVLPPNWVINHEPDSFFEFAPKAWTKPGFWEDYFDGAPEAVELFNSEKESILQFDL